MIQTQFPWECTQTTSAVRAPRHSANHCPHLSGGCATCCHFLVSYNLGPTSPGTPHPRCCSCIGTHYWSQPLHPPSWEHVPLHLHTPYQGDKSEHTLKKVTASIQTKNSPHVKKILNPHKLHRDAPTYK